MSTTTLGSLCPDRLPPSTTISLYPENISSVITAEFSFFDSSFKLLAVSLSASVDSSTEVSSIFFSEKKYDEVLNILLHANELLPKDEYEDNLFELIIDESRIYTQTNNSESCINLIKKSLEKGYPFPLHWPNFDLLRNHPEYESLNNLNTKLLHQAKENSKLEYEVHLPKSYDPTKKYPLFLCLHGDGFHCNIKNTSWYWKPDALLEKGYIVVYPQSSQMYFHNSFGWLSDPTLSRKELKDCYEQLLLDYSNKRSYCIMPW